MNRKRRAFYFWILLFVVGTAIPLFAAERYTTELGTHALTYTIDWKKPRQAHVMAQMVLPAEGTKIWAILTDYDHLEKFIPYMEESQVLQRDSRHLLLRQRGNFWRPFYRLKTKAVLWVKEEPPRSISFRAVEGDFLVYEGSWRLESVKEGTRLTYEATIEPNFWVPGWVLLELERQVLKGTFRAILRRATPESSPAA